MNIHEIECKLKEALLTIESFEWLLNSYVLVCMRAIMQNRLNFHIYFGFNIGFLCGRSLEQNAKFVGPNIRKYSTRKSCWFINRRAVQCAQAMAIIVACTSGAVTPAVHFEAANSIRIQSRVWRNLQNEFDLKFKYFYVFRMWSMWTITWATNCKQFWRRKISSRRNGMKSKRWANSRHV